jgi:hypothetical protein
MLFWVYYQSDCVPHTLTLSCLHWAHLVVDSLPRGCLGTPTVLEPLLVVLYCTICIESITRMKLEWYLRRYNGCKNVGRFEAH